MEANHTPGGGATIQFGLPGTVTYTLAIPPSLLNDERSGNLNIASSMTIAGSGAARTMINGNQTDGVFSVGPGIAATISGVTIENGETFSCAGAGGIFNDGLLTLRDSIVTGNINDCLDNALDFGGGLSNFNQFAVLTVTNSTVSGNSVSGSIATAGGIYTAGPLIMVNSTISGNTSNRGEGGGLFVLAAPVTITGSTIHANSGTEGGGLYFYSGSATILNSTIDGNLAENGGGILGDRPGTLTLLNSTLSSNQSIIDGAGIYISLTTASLFNVTLTGNHANSAGNRNGHGGGVFNAANTAFNFQNSIIAGNNNVSIIAGHAVLNPDDCSGQMISQGYNIMRTVSGCTLFNGGGVTVADPQLGPLADNGGSTQTHALLPGSPAIDAGNPGGCRDNLDVLITTDQRGFMRPANGGVNGLRCDIGAFEYYSASLFLPFIQK